MKSLYSLLIIIFIGTSFLGCATNQRLYEAPLHDLDVLSKNQTKNELKKITQIELDRISPGHRPPIESDEAGLWMVMDQAEKKLKTSGRLIQNEKLQEYLNTITCRLVPKYCDDIRVYLVRMPYFNANMAPNGAMQIWSGLLLRVQNEAQLAAVMAHELGHYLRRHSLQQMEDVINKSSALVFVQLASAVAGVPTAGDIMQYITIGSIYAFSRDQEREADGYGLALMSRAGYDPRETAKIWEQLIEENKADKDHKYPPVFLASHPTSPERCNVLKKLGEKIVANGEPYEINKNRFLNYILPHRASFLRDELRLRNFDKAEKLLNILIDKGPNKGELHFFKGELYRLRGEKGDIEKAMNQYEKATLTDSAPPETFRSIGLLCIKKNKIKKAANALNQYLECNPNCQDKEMILHMIKELEK